MSYFSKFQSMLKDNNDLKDLVINESIKDIEHPYFINLNPINIEFVNEENEVEIDVVNSIVMIPKDFKNLSVMVELTFCDYDSGKFFPYEVSLIDIDSFSLQENIENLFKNIKGDIILNEYTIEQYKKIDNLVLELNNISKKIHVKINSNKYK